jgi:hypothetical protein
MKGSRMQYSAHNIGLIVNKSVVECTTKIVQLNSLISNFSENWLTCLHLHFALPEEEEKKRNNTNKYKVDFKKEF